MYDIDIFNLVIKSNFLTKSILFVLIFFSIVSWTIIIQKFYTLNYINKAEKNFKKKFNSNNKLMNLYQESLARSNNLIGSEQIFFNGFKEFIYLNKTNYYNINTMVDNILKTMHVTMSLELEFLANYVSYLGTISCISPYIGLFGTIWSVIHTFTQLSKVNSSNALHIISPGLAEALVSTAVGLIVAIPALIAFNHINLYINKFELDYNNFIKNFVIFLRRQYIFINDKIKLI